MKDAICRCGHVSGSHRSGIVGWFMRLVTNSACGVCLKCRDFTLRKARTQKAFRFVATPDEQETA